MFNSEKKLRVGIIFGGRSGEHEVSLASAISIMAHLDTKKYEVVPIGITRTGQWLVDISPAAMLADAQTREASVRESVGRIPTTSQDRQLILKAKQTLLSLEDTLDVVFPILHGTYGEDGAIQGFLDLANVPYVGCGILGSALGMDKEKMKLIFQAVGLPTVDMLAYYRHSWERWPTSIIDEVARRLGFPCFVKPANGGSSIGISKVYHREELERAIQLAAEYDQKVVIERAINCRELFCSVLGNYDPVASVVGEVVIKHDFYSYQAKYLDDSSRTIVPAEIPKQLADEIRRLAIVAFLALDLVGLARIDFFLEEETERLYISEVNTLPSFTWQCMFPKLCEVGGLPYPSLLDHLIELAIERHTDRQRNRISV